MKKIINLVLVLACLPLGLTAQTIDTEQSVVNFRIGNIGLNTVKGTFTGMTGSVNFDPNNPDNGSFNACVDAASVNTKNKKRDEHLRKEDFFETATYPDICFQSSGIKKSSAGYTTTGMLTMHGVSKEVDLLFSYQNGILKGELVLNRLDYKVGEGYGGFMVGKEVKIEITCVLK